MDMKRKVTLFAVAMVLVIGATIAPVMADTMGMVTKHVYVNIEPNVTVGSSGGSSGGEGGSTGGTSGDGSYTTDGGLGIQTGEFYITVPFRIDANKEQVTIQIDATPLWKGDDPFNNDVAPIELCGDATIDPENANPLASSNGGSRTTLIVGNGDTINGSRSARFNAISFESSQNSHFSQDVFVTVCWDQVDPELPMGQYSGWVKLTALLFPGTP